MPSLTLIAGFRRRSLQSTNALSQRYSSVYLRSSQPTAAVSVIVTAAPNPSNLRLRGS